MEASKETSRLAFPIRLLTHSCRSRLHKCCEIAVLAEQHWAENRLSDFNLWDAGVGASAKDTISLDRRLRSDNSARDVVIGNLSTLAAWLARCIDTSTSPGKPIEPSHKTERSSLFSDLDEVSEYEDDNEEITVKEAISSIEQLLRGLISLGLSIRKAGATSRLRRADKDFNEQDPQCQELIESLTSYVQFLPHLLSIPRIPIVDERGKVHNQLDTVANWDFSIVKGSNKKLRLEQQILITSGAKRFWRFQKAKKRRQELQVVNADTKALPLLLASRREPQSQIAPPAVDPKHSIENIKSMVSSAPPSITTTNQVSAFEPDEPLCASPDFQGPATATSITRRVQHPDPPKLAKGSSVFVCPFCHLTLPHEMAERTNWKSVLSPHSSAMPTN